MTQLPSTRRWTPSSGKTTFIAALWHELEIREVPDSLRLAEEYTATETTLIEYENNGRLPGD